MATQNFPLAPGQKVGVQKQGFDFNPDLANTLANQNASAGATGTQNLNDLLANPTANTGYQTTLSGILASLQGGERDQRQALADQFKAAGAEQSGAMGNAFGNLEGQIANSHAVAAGEALKSYLPTAAQAYGDQSKLSGPALLDALKTSQSTDIANTGTGSSGGDVGANKAPYYTGIGNTGPGGAGQVMMQGTTKGLAPIPQNNNNNLNGLLKTLF